jgi:3-oxoacyl-[acyl-carrier-protein] synthase III
VIIKSVALRTPSRCITNADIIGAIREYNVDCPADSLTQYCSKIDGLFKRSGAETRYIRDRDGGELGFDLLMEAAHSAIQDANMKPSEIDLVIFCGVGRGFLEPANAVFVAKALGISCDAFDISEACMGWVRALHVAHCYFIARSYRNILIVNAEFTVYENGLPNTLRIRSDDEISHSFPALTIGEAATATVVSSSPLAWNFHFRSAPEFAPLCTLPLSGFNEFCAPDDKIGIDGPRQLVAFGIEMFRVATNEMTKFVREMYKDVDKIDLWLPHNSGELGLRKMASDLNLGVKLFAGIFRRYGNLISASIPAAIVTAEREGRLKRGHRIVLCPASAGMVFGLVEAIY